MYRLAVLNSHPIQYFAPLYRQLARRPDVDLTVYYCSLQGAETYTDDGFGSSVRWDVPLLDGYRWKLLPNLRRGSTVGGFWSLANLSVIRELCSHRYDAVLVHGHNYATTILAVLACRLRGVPVLTRGETHLGLRRPRAKRAVRQFVMRLYYNSLCTVCLPIGARNRDFYCAFGVHPSKLITVPYAVDNAFFTERADAARASREVRRAELGIPDNAVVVLYASKLVPRKRAMDLLLAYEHMRYRGDGVALVVVGSGSEEERLRKHVQRLNVPNVHFLGFRNQSELPAIYAMADVFVLPSEDEPWGLVINEVMCAGLPVLATEGIGAVPDLVHVGVNGYTFRTGDVASLAGHLDRLVGDPRLRVSMGIQSRRIIAGWGLEECVEGILLALDTMSGQGVQHAAHDTAIRDGG